MELKALQQKVPAFFVKYRFVILILVVGLVLMLIPSNTKTEKKQTVTTAVQVKVPDLEARLTQLLSQVDGAGKLQVLLTAGEGEKTIYQTDTDQTGTENESKLRTTTVTVTDADRDQTGLIRQVDPPTYLGAVVVCEGADNPQVRLAITDAVSKATGLGANCISVLKMK